MSFLVTQAEENYLKAIFKLSEAESKAVLTNAIAAEMHTAAASVTDMLRRLSEKGLLQYEKYKGVALTDPGRRLATTLIRKHRLWETFLVEKLGFAWDQVHELAEQLEHIQSDLLTERLDAFLGFPRFDPHGDPIPNADGVWEPLDLMALRAMTPGARGVLSLVSDDSAAFLQYLDHLGISLGTELEVLQRFPFDQSVRVRLGHTECVLSEKVCTHLLLKPLI